MKQKTYLCKQCGFYYAQQKWAEKCEKWCKNHHSCNIDITKHAVSKSLVK